jgi:thioesterase domain-containing protein
LHHHSIDAWSADWNPKPFHGPVVVYRATEESWYTRTTAGWDRLGCHLEVIDVPGSHDTLLDDPHVTALAADLQHRIDAVRARMNAGTKPFAHAP